MTNINTIIFTLHTKHNIYNLTCKFLTVFFCLPMVFDNKNQSNK